MKKHLIGLLIMLSTLIMLSVAAFAEDAYTITELSSRNIDNPYSGQYYCSTELLITNNTGVSKGTLILSYYTEDGTFLGITHNAIYLEKGECENYKPISPELMGQVTVVKATIWDSLYGVSMMEPLAVSRTLYPTKLNTKDVQTSLLCEGYAERVDGVLSENDSKYAGLEFERVTLTDSMGNSSVIDNGAAILRIKKTEASSESDVIEYHLKNAKLYVNGYEFCDVNTQNAEDVLSMLKSAYSEDWHKSIVTLVRDTTLPGTVYNKIMMDYYVLASIAEINKTDGKTELKLSGMSDMPSALVANPGTSFVVSDYEADRLYMSKYEQYDIYVGYYFSMLAENDVVALKYNIKYPLSDYGTRFNRIEIEASCRMTTGDFYKYNAESREYKLDSNYYKAIKPLQLTVGKTYTCRMDPFNRIFDAEEIETTKNYAIVERYVDMSDANNAQYGYEYDVLDVITLDGQSKRFYVDSDSRDIVRTALNAAGIGSSMAENAANIPIQNRIIEYKVKVSTGRVNYLTVSTNVEAFAGYEYNESTNRLYKALASNVVVLDATKYDITEPSLSDYKASSLSLLKGDIDYNGVLVNKNSNGEWCYLIITKAGATYSAVTDFAVAAANASANSLAIVDDEEVYTLRVMQNGDSEAARVNVYQGAEIYIDGVGYSYSDYCSTYLKEGAVFFYTTDSYGLVDRIDVILEGGYDYDTLKSLITEEYDKTEATMDDMIILPAVSEIEENTWFKDVDEKDNTAKDEQIQLFIAPVMSASSSSVTFGAIKTDEQGLYVDTNEDYSFSIAGDANIYEYALFDKGKGQRAFSGGSFCGFDLSDTALDGKAWLTNVPEGETDFDGIVQFAFVMAVDGVITNALTFCE